MATDGNHYKWLVTGGAGFLGCICAMDLASVTNMNLL